MSVIPTHYRAAELDTFLRSHPQSENWRVDPEYFNATEFVLFLVENQVFQVNLQDIGNLAPGLKETVDHYRRDYPQLGTEKQPLDLSGSTSLSTFRIFLRWMNHREWKGTLIFSESELIELFHFAAKYDCHKATDWALSKLEDLNLRYSRQLALAFELGIQRWIAPAVSALLTQPVHELPPEERQEIGHKAALTIVLAQLMLSDAHSRLGCVPPPIFFGYGSRSCPYYGAKHKNSPCGEAWDCVWWTKIGRELLRPRPISFDAALELVRSTEFEGVSPECKEAALDGIAAYFDVEAKIKERVVKKFLSWTAMTPYSS